MRHHDIDGLVVGYEFPDTVRCQDQEFVCFDQVHFSYLRDGVHTDLSSGLVAETPAHGETRDVLAEVPHPSWPQRVALHVPVGSDSATSLDDPLLLIWLVGLVVPVQRNADHFILALAVRAGDLLSPRKGSS